MGELEIEAAVGETWQLGEYLVTIVEIEDGEICIRIEDTNENGISYDSPARYASPR